MKTNFKLLAILIFSFSKINAQSLISSDSINKFPSTYFKKLIFPVDIQNNRFIIFNRDVTEVIKISPNGEFLFTPKYFCDCKKCKEFKGMKKLIIK